MSNIIRKGLTPHAIKSILSIESEGRKMTKINKSELMKRAWEIKKTENVNMSVAMKKSWSELKTPKATVKLNGILQYRLSNGSYVDCDDRTDEFLNKCVKNDYHKYSINQVIEILNSGKTVDNDSDWYAMCRVKPVERKAPVLKEWEPDTESYGY